MQQRNPIIETRANKFLSEGLNKSRFNEEQYNSRGVI